jgi:hypothetical protein
VWAVGAGNLNALRRQQAQRGIHAHPGGRRRLGRFGQEGALRSKTAGAAAANPSSRPAPDLHERERRGRRELVRGLGRAGRLIVVYDDIDLPGEIRSARTAGRDDRAWLTSRISTKASHPDRDPARIRVGRHRPLRPFRSAGRSARFWDRARAMPGRFELIIAGRMTRR